VSYDAITLTPAEGGVGHRLPFTDIVGATVDSTRLLLTINSYPLSDGACCGCCLASCKPHRYNVATDLFHASRDIALLKRWQLKITQIVRHAPLDDNVPTRHLLVLINPARLVHPLFLYTNMTITSF
jgi:hypothetical protein